MNAMTITDMSADTRKEQTASLRRRIAGEVRAELARQGITDAEIAAALGQNQQWFSRRKLGQTGFDAAELTLVCVHLEISVNELIERALNAKDPQRNAEGLIGSGAGTRSRDLTIMSRAL